MPSYQDTVMPDHAPSAVAELLDIAPETLRKWARELAPLLSAGAQGGKRSRRVYQDTDITVLRHAAMLLDQGLTYGEACERLGAAREQPAAETWQAAERDTGMPGAVVVLDQPSELVALHQLLNAQRETVAALQQTLETQQAALGAQSQVIEAQRAQLDALERGLQQSREDEAMALAELRRMVGKIPRWLRALLGLGV